MLISGKEKLERMRDGREVYVGSKRVKDVTTDPSFTGAAQTVAEFFDWRADAAQRDLLSFEEGGERIAISWLQPRNNEDLLRRMRAMKALADRTFGLIGRNPDQVASLITGMSIKPSVLDDLRPGCGQNLLRYYEHARKNDLYLTFAVVPPPADRPDATEGPSLRVVAEDDSGVVLSGIKLLATGSIYADEIFVGSFVPLTDRTAKQSICCALPVASPGLQLWSRRPYGDTGSAIDYPLSTRFDESDAVLVFDRVKVPWERVFLHDNGPMARQVFVEAPGIPFANHQSNVRFWSKMALVCGLAMRIAESSGLTNVQSMKETLGDLASLEGMVGAMVTGSAASGDSYGEFVSPSARGVNACTYWCLEHHNEIMEKLRTLLGGAPLQMPASVDALTDPAMREKFDKWFGGAAIGAMDRMKLYKLAWDLVGSEFAGRHMLYERFYAGNPIVNRMNNFATAPWKQWSALAASIAGLS